VVKALINIETTRSVEVIDITSKVGELVKESKIKYGICLIFTTHTTTGVIINEAERGLLQDLIRRMASLAPPGGGYLHDEIDDNAHAHLQAILLGNSAVIPVKDASLVLGTWQKVLFVELDGPRQRRVEIRLISGLDEGRS
jgi:secondary thiamine-phosphate synthase enzyme